MMKFKDNNNAIYLQIADRLCDEVLAGRLGAGDRIPSVRDYAAMLMVNANTVMRSYERLTADGVLYNRRGIGFFVADDARERILEMRKNEFLKVEVNDFFRRLALLGVSPAELGQLYKKYLENLEKEEK